MESAAEGPVSEQVAVSQHQAWTHIHRALLGKQGGKCVATEPKRGSDVPLRSRNNQMGRQGWPRAFLVEAQEAARLFLFIYIFRSSSRLNEWIHLISAERLIASNASCPRNASFCSFTRNAGFLVRSQELHTRLPDFIFHKAFVTLKNSTWMFGLFVTDLVSLEQLFLCVKWYPTACHSATLAGTQFLWMNLISQ